MKYIDATVRDDSHLTHIQTICPFAPELVGREQGNTQRLFLVRLWSTYRVRFFLHRRRHRRHEHCPIGMYDSSNESSQRTE